MQHNVSASSTPAIKPSVAVTKMLKQYTIRHPDSTIVWSGDYEDEDKAIRAFYIQTGEDWPVEELVIMSEDDEEL
jgi:hypothetical protein